MKTFLAVAVLAAGLLIHPVTSLAQAYPSKPVHLVLPYPPGGATDALTRQLGEALAQRLGQPVIVENRAGAGGTIGASYVAKQEPDGYTLLMATTGPIAISGSIYKNLAFDPLKDLDAVSLIVVNPLVLITRQDFPAKDFPGYVALARRQPNSVSYGSPGKGTSIHLSGEILGRTAAAQLLHVPYKGSGPVLQDIYGGRLDSMFADLMQVMPIIQSGKVPALAVTSKQRNPLLPDVPTIAESGYPDFEVLSWHAVFVPAGAPEAIVAKLYREISAALRTPQLAKFLTSHGGIVEDLPPADAGKYVRADARKWAQIVKEVGFTLD